MSYSISFSIFKVAESRVLPKIPFILCKLNSQLLDSQLTLTKYIDKLKQKNTNRLKILKRLASSRWGASKTTLRQMYLGYVRSTLERNLALQSICSPSQQQNLEKIQNEAVKFISGGMKSSPIPACEIDSNIEPISLRRETAVVEMVERYRRSDEENPNWKIVENGLKGTVSNRCL